MQKYLKEVENWFNKWRLSVAANKCTYSIYCKKKLTDNKNKIYLKYNNVDIPLDENPKYLGITLDHKLKYQQHSLNIKNKCFKLLNILKKLTLVL
jgi:hypothetical protein